MRSGTRIAMAALVVATTMLVATGTGDAAAIPPNPPPDAPPGATTTYQINANHDGQPITSPLAPLEKAWSTDLGATVGYPLVVGSRVFVSTRRPDGSGAALWGLDAGNGSVLWGPFSVGGTYNSIAGIAADGANVYLVNFDGLLVAVDQDTGRQVWAVQLPGQYAFTSAPTVHNGVVYVDGAGSGGTLYAVAAGNGAALWTAAVGGYHSSPVVTDDGVYVSFSCNGTYRFAPQTGALMWKRVASCDGATGTTPVLHNGKLYVRDLTHLTVLDSTTGAVIDSTSTYDSTTTPTFNGDTGYFLQTNNFLQGGTLRAIDTATSTVLWSQAGDGHLSTAPLMLSSGIAIGSTSGIIALLDPNTGAIEWSADAGAPILAPGERNDDPMVGLAASADHLFVPATNTLVAYQGAEHTLEPPTAAPPLPTPPDAGVAAATTYQINANHDGRAVTSPRATLRRAWSRDLGAPVSYPVVVGSRVFVSSGPVSDVRAALWALNARDGSVLWGPVNPGGGLPIEGIAADSANLYVVTSDGLLRALDQTTGRLVWSMSLPGQGQSNSPPTVYKGVVYVNATGESGTLYAIAAGTGALLWAAPVENGDDSAPVATDDGVYVSFSGGLAYRFAPETGALTWWRNTNYEGGGGTTPVLHNGKLYVRDACCPAVLDAATGAVVDATGTFNSAVAPTFSGNIGYFLQSGTLRAIDTSTSQVLWSQRADGRLITAPVVLSSEIAIGSASGTIYLIDPSTGKVDWSDNAGSPILSPDEQGPAPVVGLAASGDDLFVPASNTLVSYAGTESLYVNALYQRFLGRSADPAGLAYWTSVLEEGGSRTTVVSAIGDSPEAIQQLVTGQYEEILGRPPDSEGLTYWSDVASRSPNGFEPAVGLYGSSEFFHESGGTIAGWMQDLYNHLLGRSPSTADLAFWAGEAQLHGRTWVAAWILTSPEAANDQISSLYLALLGRSADFSGRGYFLNQFDRLGAHGIVIVMTSSLEYATHVAADG